MVARLLAGLPRDARCVVLALATLLALPSTLRAGAVLPPEAATQIEYQREQEFHRAFRRRDPLVAMVHRVDRFLRRHSVGGVTPDSRYALNPTEVARLTATCQLLGYAELNGVVPRRRFRTTVGQCADTLLNRFVEVRSGTVFDGMLGYAMLKAYETVGDPRYLAAAEDVIAELRAIPRSEYILNATPRGRSSPGSVGSEGESLANVSAVGPKTARISPLSTDPSQEAAMKPRIAWITVAALVQAAPAFAAFHLVKVVEVYTGNGGAPNAQYIVLQTFAAGQSFISGHQVLVYDAAGAQIGTYTFTSNLANGANQAKILVATPEAVAFFGVSANLSMTPTIPAAGGKVCWDGFDCVAWGSYSGSSIGVGTPAAPDGIPGLALKRRLDTFGSPTTLEAGDDTDNSANDFVLSVPQPVNNAGQTGTAGVGDSPLGVSLAVGPNPFRDELTVRLAMPRAGRVEVAVFDLIGRRLRTLHRADLGIGNHQFTWDGRDDSGRLAGAGVYVVRSRSANGTSSRMAVRYR